MQLTIRQWLKANGYDPAQSGLSVEIGGLRMPPQLWDSVTVDTMAMLTVEAA